MAVTAVLLVGCPEMIGDRCGPDLPPCPSGTTCVGCLDGQARILFLETDGRGIDTTAEWPMLGHDPGMTFNQSTPLGGYACA